MYGIRNILRLNARDAYFFFKSRTKTNRPTRGLLCNSFPKSGTHLLYDVLKRIPDYQEWNDIVSVQSLSGYANSLEHIKNKLATAPAHSIIRSHLAWDQKLDDYFRVKQLKMIFIVRDLRDVCVSHANWVMKEPRIYLHNYYHNQLANFDERLLASISGVIQGIPLGSNTVHSDVGRDFRRWLPWTQREDVLVVKFEQLLNKRSEKYIDILNQIYAFLEISASEKKLIERHVQSDSDPMTSHTYQKGLRQGAGAWKAYFKPEHLAAFEQSAGGLLEELGYTVE